MPYKKRKVQGSVRIIKRGRKKRHGVIISHKSKGKSPRLSERTTYKSFKTGKNKRVTKKRYIGRRGKSLTKKK